MIMLPRLTNSNDRFWPLAAPQTHQYRAATIRDVSGLPMLSEGPFCGAIRVR